MFISRIEARVSKDQQEPLLSSISASYEQMRSQSGFRWAMLLRSPIDSTRLAAFSMWLSPEQAAPGDSSLLSPDEAERRYDVTTARGSMTPARHVAIVDWQVSDDLVSRFTARWNATYHAIEDRIGSRLLKNLDGTDAFTGLHAMTDGSHLNLDMFNSPVTDADGLNLTPSVPAQSYDVLLLVEA